MFATCHAPRYLIACFCCMVLIQIAAVAEGQQITRVEEDWQVRVIDPDANAYAPQFTTVMTPDRHDSSTYFTMEFNHSTAPEFQSGGMQLQAWRDDFLYESTDRLTEEILDANNEKVSWTQFMQIDGNDLVFGLANLNSSTFGQVDVQAARLTIMNYGSGNLNDYQIANTTRDSAVGFAGNRVAYMSLREVRVYSGSQLMHAWQVNENVNDEN